MEPAAKRRTFLTLDCLRGVAAVLTFVRHMGDPSLGQAMHGIYLAVDMFFALSGFVLTHSYQHRLGRTMSTAQFTLARLIRFYPLYALGTAIGIAYAAWLFLQGAAGGPGAGVLAASAIVSLLFLPLPPALAWDARRNLYPFNFSAWSLLMEFLVNVAFAVLMPRLSNRVLAGLIALLLATLVAAAALFHGIDFGWGYGPGGAPPLGIVRSGFSFFAGVAVYRLWASGRWRVAVPAWVPPLLLILFFVPTEYGGRWHAFYDLLAVTLLFPGLIFLGACVEPRGRFAKVARVLGVSSYPLYALHSPLTGMIKGALPSIYATGSAAAQTAANIACAVLLVALALWLDRRFDQPARAALTRAAARLLHRRQPLDQERAL